MNQKLCQLTVCLLLTLLMWILHLSPMFLCKSCVFSLCSVKGVLPDWHGADPIITLRDVFGPGPSRVQHRAGRNAASGQAYPSFLPVLCLPVLHLWLPQGLDLFSWWAHRAECFTVCSPPCRQVSPVGDLEHYSFSAVRVPAASTPVTRSLLSACHPRCPLLASSSVQCPV